VEVKLKRATAGGVDITVDDEGEGIEAAARAQLFEPFFSTKSHGTGLGLAITRQIVEAHGGTISCEARVERGTRFRIHLPEADRATAAPKSQIDHESLRA
jgi:signal transduction histidine kinase